MLLPIASQLQQIAGSRPWQVVYELQTVHGIADIVAVDFDDEAIERRMRHGVGPIVDPLALRTFLQLTSGARRTPDIARLVEASARHVGSVILPQLESDGLVRRASGGWVAATEYVPIAKRIVAIEAKRRDWRSGLAQARRYLAFSNRSLLVISSTASRPLEEILVGSAVPRIGIATLQLDSERLRVLRNPRWQNPGSRYEFLVVAERAWELLASGRRTGPERKVFGRSDFSTRGGDSTLQGAPDGYPRWVPRVRLSAAGTAEQP
jgi:hypothetical protein